MVGEAVEKKLYDAATKGDVATLQQLLQQDPYLVESVAFPCSRNLLHIAAMHGQAAIVEEVLKLNPRLARISDSQKSSPLHIAAEEGHVEICQKLFPLTPLSCLKNVLHTAIMQGQVRIVEEVLKMNPRLARSSASQKSSPLHIAVEQKNLEIAKMVLRAAPEMCGWRDEQGMNPVHVAAMDGSVEILNVLIQLDLSPAMERLHRGQTVLHLCVKHRQIKTLKILVDKVGDMVCAKDDDGETLLHLAVRSNHVEIVRYLVKSKKLKELATNSMGKTARDILNESLRDSSTYSKIDSILTNLSSPLDLPEISNMTMVVAVLIATMAFQAAVSPPGGVWQDDASSHSAGKAVMATTHPKIYKHFVRANTTAFISSLITILLVIIGGPISRIYYMWITLFAIWGSMASIGVSYGASLIMTNPMETKSVGHIVAIVVSVVVFTNFGLPFIEFLKDELGKSLRKKRRSRPGRSPVRDTRTV